MNYYMKPDLTNKEANYLKSLFSHIDEEFKPYHFSNHRKVMLCGKLRDVNEESPVRQKIIPNSKKQIL